MSIVVCDRLRQANGRGRVDQATRVDPTIVPDVVEKLRERFGLSRVVLVGESSMLTQMQIDTLKQYPGLDWIFLAA